MQQQSARLSQYVCVVYDNPVFGRRKAPSGQQKQSYYEAGRHTLDI